jgi:zinc transporter ZupT
MKKHISLVLSTLVSGFLSAFLTSSYASEISKFFSAYITDVSIYMPGIVFGAIIGIWFLVTQKTNPFKVLLWAAMSALAYFIAFWAAVYLYKYIIIFAFPTAGFLGAMILAVTTSLLVTKLSLKEQLKIVRLGSIAGLAFAVNLLPPVYSTYIQYTIWQMAVGISLGVMIDSKKISQSLPVNND